jgi:CarD family transcriptional regulator
LTRLARSYSGGQPIEEDTIPGTASADLLEDDLEPDVGIETDPDEDADEDDDDELDIDAEIDVEITVEYIEFELGDNVVYPHHGAGKVQAKEVKEIFGERREYLTIKILHNDMTVMVPTENAALAGLRRVIDEETVKKVLDVLRDDVSDMPKNWNRRFKHNRDKIKTGDIYELSEVVRNLALAREREGPLQRREADVHARQEDPCFGVDVRARQERGRGRGLSRRVVVALLRRRGDRQPPVAAGES